MEKDVKFVWSSDCDQVFQKLETCLVNTPILVYPDLKKPFIIDTDASGSALVLFCRKSTLIKKKWSMHSQEDHVNLVNIVTGKKVERTRLIKEVAKM